MAEQKHLDLSDVDGKLNAPKKLSQFEKQRQEAEAKRLRDELAQQEEIFRTENEHGFDSTDDISSSFRGNTSGYGGQFGARHTTQQGPRRAGPGTLGEPPSLKRKREQAEIDEMRRRNQDHDESIFGEETSGARSGDVTAEFDRRRSRTPESTLRKPTMLLSSLPFETTEQIIRTLMPTTLKVEQVNIITPTVYQQDTERTISALVTLTADTPISDVDNAVRALDKKYLGYGCYLKPSRHVSLTGHGPNTQSVAQGPMAHPFGAKQPDRPLTPPGSLRNAPPPSSFTNMPPPGSYGPSVPGQLPHFAGPIQVPVTLRSDIKQLKAINSTAEQVIEYGAEFEALLMSRPEIQQSENWAWLFDPTSKGAIYYRWLLWSHFAEDDGDVDNGTEMFDNCPVWMPSQDSLKYEFVNELEDIVDDDEYISSDEGSGDEAAQQNNRAKVPTAVDDDADDGQPRYLNPYRKAKFTHLLARMPNSIAKLRTGDVARVTDFVCNNGGQGAEEIVDMLISNIECPYNQCVSYGDEEDEDREKVAVELALAEDTDRKDNSNSKLIGLYLISDALQATATSGIRNTWQYRALFEQALTARKTFEHLGRLEKELQWGRLKSEQWKRKVGLILNIWGESSIFPVAAHEVFKSSFNEPPLTEEERKVKAEEDAREQDEQQRKLWKSAEEKREEEAAVVVAATKDEPMTTADKIVELKRKAMESKEKSEQLKTDGGPLKRARPTAADLITTNVVEPDPAVAAAPAPKPIAGFGFKMSLVGGSGVAPTDAAAAALAKPEPKQPTIAENMFADSDGDD